MRVFTLVSIALLVWPGTAAFAQQAEVSILVDLDPAKVDRSTQIESITADAGGLVYVPDGVTGNIIRVDPTSPKPVIVGRIPPRAGVTVQTGANGLTFDARGDLYIAKNSFSEVLRIRKEELNPEKPGLATTFATGVMGANGIAFDRHGYAFVTGTGTGRIYRIGPSGGAATVVAELAPFEQTAPDGSTVRGAGPNGVAVDAKGTVYVTNTGHGEIWKIEVLPDGTVGKPSLWVKSPMIQRVDGITFDQQGTAWLAVQRNSIVTITTAGEIREVARNGSAGPLEAPTAIVFVGARAYVNNYDTPPPPNGDGKASAAGVGASIAQIEP